MMLTFGYIYVYTFLEQIIKCTMILMLSLMKIRDNNSSIALYHPPLSIHKVIHIIMLLYTCVRCVSGVYDV